MAAQTSVVTEASPPSWSRRFHAEASRRRIPIAAMLELTSRCNLRCVHCYLGPQEEQQRKRAAELDTDGVRRVIDQLVDAGCLYLTITGGDPMMRRDFPDVYRYARERGLLVSVFCDGILVHDRILDLFRELPPRRIEISLYGATAETYERVTRVPGSFAGAMRGIHRLIENRIRVSLKTVVMTLNRHELPAMEAFAASLGVPFRFDGAIFPCLPDGSQTPLDVRLKPSDIVALEMSTPERRAAWVKSYQSVQAQPASDRVYTCGAGQNSLYIDPYGQLSPCLMTTHHRFDLKQKPLQRYWNEEIAQIRELRYKSTDKGVPSHLRGACAHCPGVNRLEAGSDTRESPFVLELAQKRYEAIMQAQGALTGAQAAGPTAVTEHAK